MTVGFERGFLGIVEALFVIGEGKSGVMISGRLLMRHGNATLWAAALFGLTELGYGYGQHGKSHGGDDGQG